MSPLRVQRTPLFCRKRRMPSPTGRVHGSGTAGVSRRGYRTSLVVMKPIAVRSTWRQLLGTRPLDTSVDPGCQKELGLTLRAVLDASPEHTSFAL